MSPFQMQSQGDLASLRDQFVEKMRAAIFAQVSPTGVMRFHIKPLYNPEPGLTCGIVLLKWADSSISPMWYVATDADKPDGVIKLKERLNSACLASTLIEETTAGGAVWFDQNGVRPVELFKWELTCEDEV